jgi:hypothetical protein
MEDGLQELFIGGDLPAEGSRPTIRSQVLGGGDAG